MEHPGFFERAGPFRLSEVAAAVGARIGPGADADRIVSDLRPITEAQRQHLTFIDNRKYLQYLPLCQAGACLVAPMFAERIPPGTTALVADKVYRSFARALQLFYPDAMQPKVGRSGGTALVDPSALIEEGAHIEAGAVVGPEAQIGRGARLSAGSVVGYRCCIGRDTFIGPGASITHALVGNRVIIHGGVRIGQDGFGFAMGAEGHLKVPQIGRVIIQDDVEIGANSCVDRGALKDTVIGEGTKIDNLVQIGHNVTIGRHCVIVSQVGISGSTILEDFVVMGGQSGAAGHMKVGMGAQIAGGSHVKDDVAPGSRLIGTPARPIKQWLREQRILAQLARETDAKGSGGDSEP